MHSEPKQRDCSDIPATNELVRLVRKLRWIGMEEKAAELQKELELRRQAATADSVIATPVETD